MKSLMSFLKTSMIGGILFVVPLVLLVYLIVKVLTIFRKIVAPIADRIPIDSIGGLTMSRIIAVIILICLFVLVGILARTKLAVKLKEWIEDNILSIIPGYSLLKGVSESAVGQESKHLKDVVLVNMEEFWQIGFLMDVIDDELNAVFIPGVPNPMAGDVIFVKNERLKVLDVSGLNALNLSKKLGLDSKLILKGKIDGRSFRELQ